MAAAVASKPDILLYTNHGCPWAHRAHIALNELGIDFKEEIIDLDRPRDPWYLEINPRGLVPSISYNGTILTESAVVSQFLADAHESHLLPASTGSIDNALFRARVAFFVDTYITKVLPHFFGSMRAQSAEDKQKAGEDLVAAVVKEVEPLFTWDASKGAFFGGHSKPTLAEVQTGPFILRLLAHAKPEYDLLSPDLLPQLQHQAPKFKAWADAVVQLPSVTSIFDEKKVAERTKARFAKLAAQAKV
ncbi:hypothetical protein B0A52_06146 [Exophiala mesophila]|uniref:GST N-terminal domain-containing protein n=1 Tax=Exophiala mesophila TaxID=212818 RepID=A0A438N5E9_EXOME|nr:hypothetical protein B0A52_06146 [Exophiala mesophila]